MRKLVIILLSFLAIVTFIRAIENSDEAPMTGLYEASLEASL